MTTLIECPCGRVLRVREPTPGKRVRCPDCGTVLEIAEPPTPTPDRGRPEAADQEPAVRHQEPSASAEQPLDVLNVLQQSSDDDIILPLIDVKFDTDETDHLEIPAQVSLVPPKIQTPAWLLYLGLLSTAAIIWGTLATWKLRDRTAQMENALSRVDAAEKAAKAAIEQAEAIKKQATRDVEDARRKAETAESFGRQAEATRIAEEQKLLKQYPFLRKVDPGETVVHEEYVESFTIQNGVVHVVLRNTSESPITPDFSLVFFDKNGAKTSVVDIALAFTSIDPGQMDSAGKPIDPKAGPPVYYNCHINTHAPPRVAAGNGQVGVGQDENAAGLSRIEEAFKNTGISQAK
jgi:hypothetical protein